MTLSYEEIRQHLRHRFPFIMVDRVLEVEMGKRIKALKNVTANEIHFLGHFPDFAIMPGVFIIEAIGQSAVILFSLATGQGMNQSEILVLGAINNMRFLAPVLPGQTMIMEAKVLVMTPDAALIEGTAWVDGTVVAQGKISFARKARQEVRSPDAKT
jgi:3-hydroxyacyl-[acyl-carrier-protein] dehydratase